MSPRGFRVELQDAQARRQHRHHRRHQGHLHPQRARHRRRHDPASRRRPQKRTRCVAPTKKNRSAKHCTRYVPVSGTLDPPRHHRHQHLPFSGRLAGKRLVAVTYRLTAIPTDAARNKGKLLLAAFKIKKPEPHGVPSGQAGLGTRPATGEPRRTFPQKRAVGTVARVVRCVARPQAPGRSMP